MVDPAFLLDANVCVYLLGGGSEKLRHRIENCTAGQVVTSAVAFADVMIGAFRRDAVAEALAFFEAIPVLDFGQKEGGVYATLPFRRGSVDRLIAAHALALGLVLVTNNEADFADISNLMVENWTLAA